MERQSDAARRAGVSVRSWQAWELVGDARRTPSGEALAAIMRAYPMLSVTDLTTDPYKEVKDE